MNADHGFTNAPAAGTRSYGNLHRALRIHCRDHVVPPASPVHLGAVASAILQPPKITIRPTVSLIWPVRCRFRRRRRPRSSGSNKCCSGASCGRPVLGRFGLRRWILNGQVATDFRVQPYQGRPVLTGHKKKDLED